MINWLKNLWSKIKEITATAKKSIVDWWYKNRRKIGITIGVLLYSLCVFFLGYCSNDKDNSTAKADGLDVPVSNSTYAVIYSDVATPLFRGSYTAGSSTTTLNFFGSFSLLFQIDSNEDIISSISLNEQSLYDNLTWHTVYFSMPYIYIRDNSVEYYGFAVDVIDYNLPTIDIYGTASGMIYNSFEMSYIVNNTTNAVVTYEWQDTDDLYYIDFSFSLQNYLIASVYSQKFDYFVYDTSTYLGLYNAGYSMGYAEGSFTGYQDGYAEGYEVGSLDGYNTAVDDGEASGFFTIISKMVSDLMSIELFPNVPIAYIMLLAFGFVALRILLNLFAT